LQVLVYFNKYSPVFINDVTIEYNYPININSESGIKKMDVKDYILDSQKKIVYCVKNNQVILPIFFEKETKDLIW
jgi:hypothetical protein